jgi:hypothetical protein
MFDVKKNRQDFRLERTIAFNPDLKKIIANNLPKPQ